MKKVFQALLGLALITVGYAYGKVGSETNEGVAKEEARIEADIGIQRTVDVDTAFTAKRLCSWPRCDIMDDTDLRTLECVAAMPQRKIQRKLLHQEMNNEEVDNVERKEPVYDNVPFIDDIPGCEDSNLMMHINNDWINRV